VLVAGKLRLAFHVMEGAAAAPLVVRLERRLLMLSGGLGNELDHRRRVVVLAQDQLASMLGASRQTVNAALKELKARGLVKVAYGPVEIVGADGLRALEA